MTTEKDVQVAREKGRGGEVIWAMPERKHSFLNEVFPITPTVFVFLPVLLLQTVFVFASVWLLTLRLGAAKVRQSRCVRPPESS